MRTVEAKIKYNKQGEKIVTNYNGHWHQHVDEDGNILNVDAEGKVILRPKKDFPYTYSRFCSFNATPEKFEQAKDSNMASGSVYSDRLYTADSSKYNSACREVFGDVRQDFDTRSPQRIEAFLQKYYSDESIILLKVYEECNNSNGFPYWAFTFAQNSA